MQKVIAIYDLKKDVNIEQYKKWLLSVEMKVTPKLPGIHKFEVLEIKGSDGEDKTYSVIEDFTVDSYEAWQKAVSSDVMKDVSEGWKNYADETTLKIFYGEIIV